MDKLRVYSERTGDTLVISLQGSAGISEVDQAEREMLAAVATPAPIVVLDLGTLEYTNSLLVGLMMKVNQATKAGGGKVRIARPTEYVRGVLDAMKVGKVLPIFPDLESASKP